jgi:hypothetical protein
MNSRLLIENLGKGSSVIALDESRERHPAILASQFWAGQETVQLGC